jgi:glycosyltransferase involved in cell wall biosynthesis
MVVQEVKTRERPYILYVGRRRFYKNFAVLAAAFTRSADLRAQYDLICVGGEVDVAEQLADVRYERVEASDAELAGLYAGAVAFVYSSRYEGFGLPLIEAMSCGCPVITTRGGSLEEIAGDAAEYFEPDSSDELIEAIQRVTRDRLLRARLIAAGRHRAAGFTWDRCVEATLSVYRQVADYKQEYCDLPDASHSD